ncbi:MAG: histidinol-phosphatase [Nitrospiria bacterium]
MKTNFHTHTFRCKHATGDAIDYAWAAFQQGSRVLGISDHAPLPDNRWPEARMAFHQLDAYDAAISSAQQRLPEMQVLKGMECEYDVSYHAYYQDELLGERHYDYLIGAGHYTPLNGHWLNSFVDLDTPAALAAYARYLGEMMDTALFDFIAHPDIFGCSHDTWSADVAACSRDILEAAEATQTPLEINGNGFRKPHRSSGNRRPYPYPWRPFWEMAADFDIQVICNADAHHPEHVLANIEDAQQLAEALQLDVIYTLTKGMKHAHKSQNTPAERRRTP